MPQNNAHGSDMDSEVSSRKKNGFFGDEDSNKTFMKITGIIAAFAVVVLIVILPVYFKVIEPNNIITVPPPTTEPLDNEKFNCLPGVDDPSLELCIERGCFWSDSTEPGVPSCYFGRSSFYGLSGDTVGSDDTGFTSELKLSDPNAGKFYGKQYTDIVASSMFISDTSLRIKIYPKDIERYEVPLEHPAQETISSPLYKVEHSDDGENFGVKVTRVATGKILFDTSLGQMMFAEQFLQISTKVASEYIYGFGEHMHETLKHDMNWITYGMFTFDQNVKPDFNLYGVQTYFTCMEGDGNAYGVLFVNSNAMEVELQPTPAITYRTVGGILDFYIFFGPSPEEVNQQYMRMIGMPYFPPYWSLGFQLCRWGYNSLENLTTVVDRNLKSGIPYDVQYSDIDYMERQLDFTIDNETYNGITDFVLNLKSEYKMRYIIIIDPAISGNETEPYPTFDNGVRDDVFIKYPNGEIAWGKVWPDLPGIYVNKSKDKDYQVENYRAHTAYPDFFHPNTSKWWKQLIVDFRDKIEFDGLWIDMNEPTSFTNGRPEGNCPESIHDNPPYLPNLAGDTIYDLSICMQTIQYHPVTKKYTEHYNLHSLYGWSETLPTLEACRDSTGERCIVLTRATYPGAGKYSGHWLGDNISVWSHLQASIIGMIEFTLFGFPYNGADVCGFFQDTNEQLCLRWMQLGAFYPFYRNHNIQDTIDQDPAVFGTEFIENIKPAMETRYALLPYLYTLFYHAHTTGSTVVRALMHQFPTDIKTYTIDRQFLWGSALLITAVVEEDATAVTGYFPSARWYNYYSGEEVENTGQDVDLPTAINEINVHVLGGYILPTQQPGNNTYYSRQNPMGLVVALDEVYKATGDLFWDDGNSIDTIENGEYALMKFNCEASTLYINITKQAPTKLDISSLYFENISIYGVQENTINNVVVGESIRAESGSGTDGLEWELSGSALMITKLNLAFGEEHTSNEEEPKPAESTIIITVTPPTTPRPWIYESERVDCSPDKNITKAECEGRGCVYSDGSPSVPTCFFSGPRLYSKDGDTIYPNEERYEVPMEHPTGISKRLTALYSVQHSNKTDEPGVKIIRKLNSSTVQYELENLWNVFKRQRGRAWFQFVRSTTVLSMHGRKWKRVWRFLRQQQCDGCTLQPTPAITYRTTGGIFDFYIFLGPTPEQVTQQYTEIIGRPFLPPYWSLGFQLCRWEYGSLENLTKVVERNLAAGIPYEVQYSDIDYMERQLDFTIDNDTYYGLEDFVSNLKEEHKMRYIIILDPAISGNETTSYPAFDNGIRDNIFIKTPNGNLAWGKVWPDLPGIDVDPSQDWDYKTEHYRSHTAYPDFFHPNTSKWWTDLIVDFYGRIKFDRLWIDMNEPASFTDGSPNGCPETSKFDNPPYSPKLVSDKLYEKTICMNNMQYHHITNVPTEHYNLHSLYGHSECQPTLEACRKSTGERCLVLTRSTYPGSGKYAGHWLGDNTSKWSHLGASIIGMQEYSLFGVPYVGADVCGFFEDTEYELCIRWMQLGAFYPFYRNHNVEKTKDQDPAVFGPDFVSAVKPAMLTRQRLLPYLYTLFYDAHVTGSTVVRPLMNVFPDDPNTYTTPYITTQFMWGSGLMIMPVLEENWRHVNAYMPANARWYDFYSGKELGATGAVGTFGAPLNHIVVYVNGGNIIPTQEPSTTTYHSRQNAFGLIVAPDNNGKAEGKLFWDDGVSIDTITNMEYTEISFSLEMNTLISKVTHSYNHAENLTLGIINIFGVNDIVTTVKLDGIDIDFTYDNDTNQIVLARPNSLTCNRRGCIWDPSVTSPDVVPSCFYALNDKEELPSYKSTSLQTGDGITNYTLTRNNKAQQIYGEPSEELKLSIEYQTSNRLHFKISDSSEELFEIPSEIFHMANAISSNETEALYQVLVTEEPFSLKILRKSTGKIIFDTSVGPLVFENKYLEISTTLSSDNVFGFGEHNHKRYR
uniref:maltase-glucoamylase, intestinal-like n=1 Tax=Styela clava TaxID=7725 RepID=UPI00193A3469|nr:maltase-glucoamylase, intestinal-like [Styela clava]